MQTDKLKAMVLGAFYGDAYSLGAHWVYDTDEIEKASLDLDGCNAPISEYHPTKTKGDFTHYGDQMLWLLEDLASHKIFSLVDYGKKWHENMLRYQGYVDGASKHTLEKLSKEQNYFACGSPSSDLSVVSRMFPLILIYKDTPDDMQESIKLHTILTHMNKDLVQAGSFFSEVVVALIHGAKLEDAIDASAPHHGGNIVNWIAKAKEVLDLDTKDAIKKLGQACSVNGAFASTIYILLKYKDDFFEALKQNMLAGGDSSARGMMIGGILGLIHHEKVLSAKCLNEVNTRNHIESLIDKLL